MENLVDVDRLRRAAEWHREHNSGTIGDTDYANSTLALLERLALAEEELAKATVDLHDLYARLALAEAVVEAAEAWDASWKPPGSPKQAMTDWKLHEALAALAAYREAEEG